MASPEANVDYYAVLEISKDDTSEVVTKSYRRLALIRHPDKNPSNDSTAAFQLLQSAYEIISDPAQRQAYDLRWPSIRDGLRAQQESEKRKADAAQAEKKRTAEAREKKQEEDNAREQRLRILEQSRWRYDDDLFELSRRIRKLVADMKRLKDQDDEDVRKERERKGWWAYLTSPIYGRVKETDEQKQERDTKRIHRLASKRIKGSELAAQEARLQRLQDMLRGVNERIATEKQQKEDEKRRVEEEAMARKLKAEQEARERAMREAWERRAKAQKEQSERAAKDAREAQAAREARAAQERVRAAAERRRREEEDRAEAVRRAEKAAAAKKARDDWSGLATESTSTCRHEGWWPKVEGRQLCGQCHTFQNRFALRCPGCKMVACASCQKRLRGGGTWKDVGGRQHGFAGSVDNDCDNSHRFDWYD